VDLPNRRVTPGPRLGQYRRSYAFRGADTGRPGSNMTRMSTGTMPAARDEEVASGPARLVDAADIGSDSLARVLVWGMKACAPPVARRALPGNAGRQGSRH
jgi:hypothetical protein